MHPVAEPDAGLNARVLAEAAFTLTGATCMAIALTTTAQAASLSAKRLQIVNVLSFVSLVSRLALCRCQEEPLESRHWRVPGRGAPCGLAIGAAGINYVEHESAGSAECGAISRFNGKDHSLARSVGPR